MFFKHSCSDSWIYGNLTIKEVLFLHLVQLTKSPIIRAQFLTLESLVYDTYCNTTPCNVPFCEKGIIRVGIFSYLCKTIMINLQKIFPSWIIIINNKRFHVHSKPTEIISLEIFYLRSHKKFSQFMVYSDHVCIADIYSNKIIVCLLL